MLYIIEKILENMEKDNNFNMLELEKIEKEIKILEKSVKILSICTKKAGNRSKTQIKAKILDIIG